MEFDPKGVVEARIYGPQRCSGDTRAKLYGSMRNVAALQEQHDKVRDAIAAAPEVPDPAARKPLSLDEWAAQARGAGLDEESLAVYRKRYEAGKSDLQPASAAAEETPDPAQTWDDWDAEAHALQEQRDSREAMTWGQWAPQARAAGLGGESPAVYREGYEAGKSGLV